MENLGFAFVMFLAVVGFMYIAVGLGQILYDYRKEKREQIEEKESARIYAQTIQDIKDSAEDKDIAPITPKKEEKKRFLPWE